MNGSLYQRTRKPKPSITHPAVSLGTSPLALPLTAPASIGPPFHQRAYHTKRVNCNYHCPPRHLSYQLHLSKINIPSEISLAQHRLLDRGMRTQSPQQHPVIIPSPVCTTPHRFPTWAIRAREGGGFHRSRPRLVQITYLPRSACRPARLLTVQVDQLGSRID